MPDAVPSSAASPSESSNCHSVVSESAVSPNAVPSTTSSNAVNKRRRCRTAKHDEDERNRCVADGFSSFRHESTSHQTGEGTEALDGDRELMQAATESKNLSWRSLSWWGCGIRSDLRRRLPWYISDWTDGLYFGVLAASLLLFFAQVAPGMSFGEALEKRTNHQIGVIEALLATGISSAVYAVTAGQPLVVVGLTGPSTVLYGTMYQLSKHFDIAFLPWMFWVCLWCFVIMLLFAVTNAANLVMYLTRFTVEGFEVLVAVTYVTEAVRELIHLYGEGSLSNFLASAILAIAVLYITLTLHSARAWPYFNGIVRELIASYAVAFAVVTVTAVSYVSLFKHADIIRLEVPDTWNWSPTSGRAWLVPFWEVNALTALAGVVPGALMAVLYFFDTSVSAILTQQQEFGLRKGPSFHYDTLVQGMLVLVCGILGLPALNGLLPQSPLHVRALADIGHRQQHPSGPKEEFYIGVHETRVAALMQAGLFFLILGFLQIPATIPKGVFVGLFLYFGCATFMGNSLVDRLQLLFGDFHPRSQALHDGIPNESRSLSGDGIDPLMECATRKASNAAQIELGTGLRRPQQHVLNEPVVQRAAPRQDDEAHV